MSILEGQLLWSPPREVSEGSNVVRYMSWLREHNIVDVADYHALWCWSVGDIEAFWASLWDYFEIISDTPYEKVTDSLEM
ncbi:MAG: acetoacetate--CoA ligase, partial [Gammaproteobacteria bacterium]